MTNSVIITGAAGFTGKYMCEYLRSLKNKLKIIGLDIREIHNNIYDEFHITDISDSCQVKGIVNKYKPKYIIHLAGTFGTGDNQQIYKANVLSTTAILEAVLEFVPDSIFIAAGSAAEYGEIDVSCLPVTEGNSCKPVTPYGLSKYLATVTAQYYHRVHGLCTMIVRPFQLVGKGVTSRLAPGAFAKRLIEARKSGINEIKVGNLESSRDFLDVRDAVKSIWMLCEKPASGEIFNLCGGKPVKISELLDLMINSIGTRIRPVTETEYLKGNADVNVVYGSYQKINKHCGWEPSIPLQESIKSMFEGVSNEE
jgi:GDP-4-dehydro-6-deoxy-D-mannose reductase